MTPSEFHEIIMLLCNRYGCVVTSYYRTPAYNKKIGGEPGSLHQEWTACDIAPAQDGGEVHIARGQLNMADEYKKRKEAILIRARRYGLVGYSSPTKAHIHLQALKPPSD